MFCQRIFIVYMQFPHSVLLILISPGLKVAFEVQVLSAPHESQDEPEPQWDMPDTSVVNDSGSLSGSMQSPRLADWP